MNDVLTRAKLIALRARFVVEDLEDMAAQKSELGVRLNKESAREILKLLISQAKILEEELR